MLPRPRVTYCPACDEPLDVALVTVTPVCPACGQRLVLVEVALLVRRVAAAGLDAAILLATAGLLNAALLLLAHVPPLLPGGSGLATALHLLELDPWLVARRFAPFLVMTGLYLALFWTLTGRTPGARVLGLRVVDREGRPPSPSWTIVRVAGVFLGALPLLLGWWWAAFDLERRAWHDHVSRTYVVRET